MAAKRLHAGDRLGRYEIIDRIDFDSGCVRYLARVVEPRGLGKSVVIKRFEEAKNELFLAMFMSEAEIGKLLQHPNIAELYEVGCEDGCHFMAVEYVHGEYLYRIPHQQFQIGAVLALGVGIAAGLDYAHDKTDASGRPLGFVHCDVSPATVMVTFDGQVKLTDFRHERAGQVGGKRIYLSPEQIRGKPLDRRSDLFNIGLILYEITTGRFPFSGSMELEIYKAILEQAVEPPTRRDATYPVALERVVMTALERDPAKRQQTARALGAALEAAARELGVECALARLFPPTLAN